MTDVRIVSDVDHLCDCLFLSLEEIGVVITEARPPLFWDRGRLPGILMPRRVK